MSKRTIHFRSFRQIYTLFIPNSFNFLNQSLFHAAVRLLPERVQSYT